MQQKKSHHRARKVYQRCPWLSEVRILIDNLRCCGHEQATWLFTERNLGVKLGANENKSREQQGKELSTTGVQVQCHNHSATMSQIMLAKFI